MRQNILENARAFSKTVLAGLFFNRTFEAGPPFGGSQKEYEF
jgi:hypothetical protein